MAGSSPVLVQERLDDLDVEVMADDVRFSGNEIVLELMFSDRVHDAIDTKLAHSIMVRLLGKSIGYQALFS